MKSIITEDLRHCILSGCPDPCIHHVFGASNRKISDEDGLVVPLDPKLHNEGGKPEPGVRCDMHHCRNMRLLMEMVGQLCWEREYIAKRRYLPFDDIEDTARQAFRERYGKSVL